MLFRVKSVTTGETHKLTAEGTVEDLRMAVAATFGVANPRLSLNKKTEISGANLHDAGLRSGDLVYLMDGGEVLAQPPLPEVVMALPPAVPDAAPPTYALPRALAERVAVLASAAKPTTAQELLLVVVHASMLDAGFVARDVGPSGMPTRWKPAPGMFAMQYEHPSRPATAANPPPLAAEVKGVEMGAQGHGPDAMVALTGLAIAEAGVPQAAALQLRWDASPTVLHIGGDQQLTTDPFLLRLHLVRAQG